MIYLLLVLIFSTVSCLAECFNQETCAAYIPSTEFVIIAGGMPINDKLLREEVKNRTVVALDGASTFLNAKGISYHVLLGDFDSVAPDKVRATFDAIDEHSDPYEYQGYLVVPAKDQDKTDLSKGIEFCDAWNATKIIIFGAIGNREDHTEWNKNLLKKYHSPRRPLMMRGELQTLRYVAKEESPYHFFGNKGDVCGFFAYPENVVVTTQGLLYDVVSWTAVFAEQASVCNELLDEQASIDILDGPGLLVIEPNPRIN